MDKETESPLTADEELTLDQVACEFLAKHWLVTGEEGIFVWDGCCYRPRSKLYLENLVFGETPVQFRDRMFSYLVKNIITRCYCETDRLLSAHCFDGNGHLLLNCANGIVRWQQDRGSGVWWLEEKVEPPDKERLFTAALAANYDPSAKCPETNQALKEIQPEEEDRRALWLFGSYLLVPDCRLEQCLFWKGLGGSGMGTAAKIYTASLGESLVTNLDMNILGDNKRYGLSLLRYAMLNLSTELSTTLVEDTAIWKALVVGEYTMGRNLYEQYKKLKSSCKHILQGNNLPNIKKATKADLRRIVPLAFRQEFTKEDRDVELKKHMDMEGDGMLLRMIQGVPELLWLSSLPEGGRQSVALAKRMSVRMDPTGVFLDKCTCIDPLDEKGQGICCFKEDLIWAYNAFMKECGMHQMVDESGRWIGRLYDDYNIVIRQPRAYNPRRKRVLLGIDLTPAWRTKLIKECGVRPPVPSATSDEEIIENSPWMRKYYHPKKYRDS